MTGAVDGLAHLRLAVLQRFERDAAQLAVVDFAWANVGELLDLRVRSGHQQPIRHAAAERIEAGGREFIGTHHQARRKADERETAIEFARDDRRHLERARTDTNGAADGHFQRIEQRGVDPDGAGRGNGGGGRAGLIDGRRNAHARRAADTLAKQPSTPPGGQQARRTHLPSTALIMLGKIAVVAVSSLS